LVVMESSPPAQTVKSFFHRIMPPAMIGFGLVLTAAWTILLVYGLYRVAGLAL
jgi:hypothetical protein